MSEEQRQLALALLVVRATTIVNAQGAKDFLANICCESYPDLAQHSAEIAEVERCRPTFKESEEVAVSDDVMHDQQQYRIIIR